MSTTGIAQRCYQSNVSQTVGTGAAVKVASASSTRRAITFVNIGTTVAVLGLTNAVTTATGFGLPGPSSFFRMENYSGDVWFIGAATATLCVWEEVENP